MVILVVLLFRTGCFTVDPTEQTLTFQFGKLLKKDNGESVYTSGKSQAFWVWPQPVGNTLSMASPTSLQKVTTDRFWFQESDSVVSRPDEEVTDSTDPIMLGKDGYVLTGDSYMFHVKATLYYKIENAEHFYLSFYKLDESGNFDQEDSLKLADKIIKSHLDQAIAMESTRWNVDGAFYNKINLYRSNLLARIQNDIKGLNYGIKVDRIDIKSEDRKPLKQMQATFSNVRKAEIQASDTKNKAKRKATKIRSEADEKADKIRYDAVVYKDSLIKRLKDLQKLDSTNEKDLVYLYIEAMAGILESVDHSFVIRKDENGNDTYWLQLGKEKHQLEDGGDDASE